MIIDAHTHLGRKGGALEARAVDLIKSMDEAHIDKALVLAGRINGITTEEVLEEIKPFKDRLYAVASISLPPGWDPHKEWGPPLDNPGVPNKETIDRWIAAGIRGFKFYPGYEYFHPADTWLRPYLWEACRANLPVIFHSGDCFCKVGHAKLKYALPLHIDDLAVEMPDLKIIIAHMGYPWQREAAEVVYKNKNVYADISGFVYGDFTLRDSDHFRKVMGEFVEIAGGWKKLLFGTDWPISNQPSYIRQLLGELEVMGHIRPIPGYLDEMMSLNAQNLFRIS